MNQRLDRVNGCHPLIQQPVLRLVELCEQKLKRKLLLVYGFRSVQEQLLIYQKGRAFDRENAVWVVVDKDAVVTNALPGLSAHNVVTVDGKPAAMAKPETDAQRNERIWRRVKDQVKVMVVA